MIAIVNQVLNVYQDIVDQITVKVLVDYQNVTVNITHLANLTFVIKMLVVHSVY
jgi:hypothetical protein